MRLFFVTFLVVTVLGQIARAATQNRNSDVQALLVIVGDQHSAYDKTAQLVGEVDRLKEQHGHVPLAVLINGDSLEYGNIIARRSGARIDLAMFAALARRAPTILNLGNHEPDFHDPTEAVAKLRAAGVTVISGNARDRRTSDPLAPASTVLKLGTYEATVVGFMTDRLATFRAAIRPDLDLADPVVWARQNVPELLKGSLLPIVLSHSGIRVDREILPLTPPDTLFAGAHDHLRFIRRFGSRIYFHSGSWMEFYSLARLRWRQNRLQWEVEQLPLDARGRGDPELIQLIRDVHREHLTPEDNATVGITREAMPVAQAARFAAEALQKAAQVDTAFIGNTTFGAGLPEGPIAQIDFDACVRFDGPIFTAEVDGARLQQLVAAANEDEHTPFARRKGEFSFAGGRLSGIDPEKIYRIATTDWGAKNSDRYFGTPAIAWQEHPTLKLKAAVLQALKP